MPLSPRSSRSASLAVALPVWIRWAGHRYALPLLFVLATLCVTFGTTRQAELTAIRVHITQGFVPLWQAMAAPGQAVHELGTTLADWRDTYADNTRLRADNAALLQWRDTATRLAADNTRLAQLAGFVPPPATHALTARVVADLTGPYQNAVLVLAGANDGIAAGAVVLAPDGSVIGRVTELGERTARVLLLRDPGSRIPVRLEQSDAAAIAAGTGAGQADLIYLPRDVIAQAGEQVVTSGHGGIFPSGLPLGMVEIDGSGVAHLQPAKVGVPEIVRIVDFQVAAPISKPAAEIPAAKK